MLNTKNPRKYQNFLWFNHYNNYVQRAYLSEYIDFDDLIDNLLDLNVNYLMGLINKNFDDNMCVF